MDENQLKLITDWFRRARESQEVHYESEKFFKRIHYTLGIPATLLSAIVGTSVFAVLESEADGNFKILLSILSLSAASLVGLNTFLDNAMKAERHRLAGAEYGAIRRKLEIIKTSHQAYANAFNDEMNDLQDKFDELAKNSPVPPNCVAKKTIKRLKSTSHDRIFQILPKS